MNNVSHARAGLLIVFFSCGLDTNSSFLEHRNILPRNRNVSRSLSNLFCIHTSIQAMLRLLPVCRFPEGHTCFWHPQWKQNSQNLSDLLHTSPKILKTNQMILHKNHGPIKHLCCGADPGGRSLEMTRQIAAVHFFWRGWSWQVEKIEWPKQIWV